MPSGFEKAATAAPSAQGARRRHQCLFVVILKGLCTLVCLNLYVGSQIPVADLEDSLVSLMHLDGQPYSGTRRKSAANSIVEDRVESAKSMAAPRGEVNSTLKGMITPNLMDGTLQGKERLWEILQTRNVTQVDADYWMSIPSWGAILSNIHARVPDGGGSDAASPIIHGLETCKAFRDATSSKPSQRRLAPAGMFNTGTNYLSVLLEYNCQNPDRVAKFKGNAKRGHGNEWEVPWGKHTPASWRGSYFKNKVQYTVEEVLPVVLIRNPYGWMKSTCSHPYTASWKGMQDKKTCPRLKTDDGEGYNPVDIKYGAGTSHHKSLGHAWSDWYGMYFYGNGTAANGGGKSTDAPFPRLMVRFEDLIFFPYETTKQICECAGGVLGHRQDDKDVPDDGTFHYVVRSAKAGFGHGPASQRNGLIDSWQRYGSSDPKDAYSREEVDAAEEVLDSLIMSTFGYA